MALRLGGTPRPAVLTALMLAIGGPLDAQVRTPDGARVPPRRVIARPAAAPADSRTTGPALGLGIGYLGLFGADFDNTHEALGFEAVARFRLANRVTLSGGAHYSRHGVEETDADDIDHWSLFLDPRYTFPRSGRSSMNAFVGLRFAWIWQKLTAPATRFSASGPALGPTGGLSFQLSSSLALETMATLMRVRLGNVEVDSQEFETHLNGTSFSLLAGLIYGF